MLKGIPLPAVLVDIETTGGIRYGRITEIAIIEIGETEVTEWSTLVNPQIELPNNIQLLTGITNDMVAAAPRFEDIAEEVSCKLKDKLFIAHNVSFDYGFLRKELGGVGISFKAPLMCSVLMSRALYPAAESHSLENIITRHGISVKNRHRALDDARATYRFLELCEAEHGAHAFRSAFHRQFQHGDLPLSIDPDIINQIPRKPGIYYLWDKDNKLIYIGKSDNVRVEIFAQFLSGEKSPLEAKLASQTADITWEVTPGKLSAIILHANKIELLNPQLNKRAQIVDSLCSVILEEDANGWLLPRILFANDIATSAKRLYGMFSTEKHASKEIRKLFLLNNLCLNKISLQGNDTFLTCQNAHCLVCSKQELFIKHNIRLQAAFEKIALKRWPFKTPVTIKESGVDRESVHIIVSNWCLLGIARNLSDYDELFSIRHCKLDRNIYRHLVKFFSNDQNNNKIKILIP